MTKEVCIVVAESRKFGIVFAVNSFTKEQADRGEPLTYCERMERDCHSHRNFTVLAMTWDEWHDRYPDGRDQP